VFKTLHELDKNELDNIAFLIPQNEGSETDGQYSRLLRTKLDEEGFENVDIISPFEEDIISEDSEEIFHEICLSMLAGDIIWNAPSKSRDKYFNLIIDLIKEGQFDLEQLKILAQKIAEKLDKEIFGKNILAVGELNILFDELLDNYTFRTLEGKGNRVVYSPLSEVMWMMWKDYIIQNKNDKTFMIEQRLKKLKDNICDISKAMLNWSPFEAKQDDLILNTDRTLGYFSGAHGRYRQAKQLSKIHMIDGVITVASIYENTGIALEMLQKDFEDENTKPVLNLTFDGNKNENDLIKIESFMYYL
jgi:predicted nucleotide-binding protein (sugar kinase/HSP70/actin superfamily)